VANDGYGKQAPCKKGRQGGLAMNMVTPQQIAKTLKLLADSGIEGAEFQDLLGSGRLPKLFREFREPKLNIATYKVVVDYSLSIECALKVGKCKWVFPNPTYCPEFFPPHELREEEERVEIQVVRFDRARDVRQVLTALDKRGLQPTTLHELLAFGAAYPRLVRKHLLMTFGPYEEGVNGTTQNPWLCDNSRYGRGLLMNLVWSDGPGFADRCRVVAVSK